MALQQLFGVILPISVPANLSLANSQSVTLDAAGESRFVMGQIMIEGGGTKTFDNTCTIMFRTGVVTFANAGTNIRIGIQDLTAAGLNDDVFDVYADFTGGSGTLASNTWYEKAMTNGSKSITHGDRIAIGFEMTTRGGTDSVIISQVPQSINTSTLIMPYGATDAGAGPVKDALGTTGPIAILQFGDGSLGWVYGAQAVAGSDAMTTISFNQTSTPDEYGTAFKVPFRCRLSGFSIAIGDVDSADDFELIVYSDIYGTPTVEATESMDGDQASTGSTTINMYQCVLTTPVIIEPGDWYCLAYRPTTNNNGSIGYRNGQNSTFTKYKRTLPIECDLVYRTNQTGVFTVLQSYHTPIFQLHIDQLDDGAGGSGPTPSASIHFG